jgi:hypothetical protein
VWPLETETLLPGTVDWRFVQTGYSPKLAKGRADWPTGIYSWRDAVAYVVSQVLETGSRIALIGCGGLGMLIAHELKQRGVVAIVLGGALQVLFGIKGNRWKNHAVISQLWNEEWVYPLEEETPRGAEEIEGGCYWGKN